MSTFGLIVMLLFIVATGGLVALLYGGNTDLALSKILMLVLQLLIAAEVVLALYEYPCYVVDGIIFVCMGEPMLAWIMLGIFALIIVFVLAMILPRINWRKSLTVSPGKLIFTGLLLMLLLGYTELFNGIYSFDSYDQFIEARQRYEEYDDRFLPTKYIRSYSEEEGERIALYPFDVTGESGPLPVLYKGVTFEQTNEYGITELFYYPFTYRLYEGADPLTFDTLPPEPEPEVSGSDASLPDGPQDGVSDSEVSGSEVSAADEQ